MNKPGIFEMCERPDRFHLGSPAHSCSNKSVTTSGGEATAEISAAGVITRIVSVNPIKHPDGDFILLHLTRDRLELRRFNHALTGQDAADEQADDNEPNRKLHECKTLCPFLPQFHLPSVSCLPRRPFLNNGLILAAVPAARILPSGLNTRRDCLGSPAALARQRVHVEKQMPVPRHVA